jgi:hypothetical protein
MNQIRNQLSVALPILLVTAAVSAAMYFLLQWQPNREARRGFEAKAESLSRMLAQTIHSAVEFDDTAATERDLQSGVATETSLTYVIVRKADGSVMGGVKKEAAPSYPDLLRASEAAVTEGDFHHVAVPIGIAGKPAWLQAGFSMTELRDSYAGTRVTSLIVALITALSGVLLAFSVGRSSASRLGLMQEIGATAQKLRAASENILGACNEQAAGTTEQGAAIDETRRTMSSLLEAAKKIADASQEVFKNADHTAQTTLNISDAIKQLTNQAQKISDISEVIRSISDKSDLLALNASLEGTKAGDAGRGFTLVAAEMRRLAESVMAAAREIKALASNIRAASDSSVTAADEGRTLAGRTSESAREITLVTVQQRNATEQVTTSMDEVSQLLNKSAEGTRATERAAQALSQLADQLTQLTARFAQQQTPGA